MNKPLVRDSLIPCKNCKKGTLHWNPEEKVYVCTSCGVQEKALKTWINAGTYRAKRKENKLEKERQWALDILGIKDPKKKTKKKNKQKKSKEDEWADIIEKVKK